MCIKDFLIKHKKEIFFVLGTYLLWHILLVAIIFIGSSFFPTTNQYLYTEKVVLSPSWLWSRANFDGIHYLDIARKGYGIYQQAFFPIYPALISFLSPLFKGNNLFVGLIISWCSFLFSLLTLFALVKLDFDRSVSKRTIIYLLVFPTSFFFASVYTESLFFFLVILSFYLARKKYWLFAGIIGALASATRVTGVLLLPALLIEWWLQKNEEKGKIDRRDLINIFPLFLIPIGLLGYMSYLAINFQDAFLFIKTQSMFGAGRSGNKLILLPQVVWRYLKMMATVKKDSLTYFNVINEFVFFIFSLVILTKSLFNKKIRLSYLFFGFASLLLPTLTGTFLSIPRFTLVIFPIFIFLATVGEKSALFNKIYISFSLLLSILCTILFTRGYWIA